VTVAAARLSVAAAAAQHSTAQHSAQQRQRKRFSEFCRVCAGQLTPGHLSGWPVSVVLSDIAFGTALLTVGFVAETAKHVSYEPVIPTATQSRMLLSHSRNLQ
jgi:hypothetical protein